MNNSFFSKSYCSFAFIYCSLISLIAIVTIVLPPAYLLFSSDTKIENVGFFEAAVRALYPLLTASPQPIALAGIYFFGGIGKRWYSHALFLLLVFSFSISSLLFLYVVFYYLTGDAFAFYNSGADINTLSGQILIPTIVISALHQTIFPVAFTIVAFIVGAVSVWKRLLPLFSFVLVLLIVAVSPIVIAIISLVISSRGAEEATISQWFMVGSIGWGLISLGAFVKNRESN